MVARATQVVDILHPSSDRSPAKNDLLPISIDNRVVFDTKNSTSHGARRMEKLLGKGVEGACYQQGNDRSVRVAWLTRPFIRGLI